MYSFANFMRLPLALLVVLHHIVWYAEFKLSYEFGWFSSVAVVMQVAVDVFFVMSGFFVARSLSRRNVKDFLLARFIKIAPLYYVITLAIALLILFRPDIFGRSYEDLPLHLLFSLCFIPYVINGVDGPLLSVGWSLNYEVFFYFSSAMVFVLFKQGGWGRLLSFSLLAVAIYVFSYYRSDQLIDGVLVEFVIGFLIYRYREVVFCLFEKNYKFLFFLMVIFGVVMLWFGSSGFESYARMIPMPFAVIAFVVIASQSVVIPFADVCSEYSLPIYLIHLPVIYVVMAVSSFWFGFVFVFVLTALFSYVWIFFYKWNKKNVRKLLFS